ncbi:MAG: RNA-binding transcriptional accessory protein [Opitutae bacterium]|nr:RNA-binding transcriptional accessory protein [Opitutae bacterium]
MAETSIPGIASATTEPAAAHVLRVSAETGLAAARVAAVVKLLAAGATVPFIARYRKEATGEMDEVQIATIRDRLDQLRELDARRATILKSLDDNKHLTPALKSAVEKAETATELEDIYAPYRPKRRTRATVARERGLEPLADFILANQDADAATEAAKFVAPDKDVAGVAEALAGARDIVAERISDDKAARAACREIYEKSAELSSEVIKGREEVGAKFKDYFAWREPLASAPSHRVLAIRRGEKEGFLFFRISVAEDEAISRLERIFVAGNGGCAGEVRAAIRDSWKRLLSPSLETEARLKSKERADAEAIRVFAANVAELLMAPALGQKSVLALDPGFRTGCKLVVLDAQGKLLHHEVIFPTAGSQAQYAEAENRLRILCHQFKVQAIAIGNGTASRETEAFVRQSGIPTSIPAVVVNESGASIYSASEVAREEFPNEDVTVRGAVSIGRRLMDPLAELVKIDPKSIGVGQYQHDVNQISLKRALDDVVISCVNKVGVEVNTASKQLLSYVSGLNATIAANIVAYRNEHGAFRRRSELKNVPRLGEKAFEQCAGFLRIRESENPLDASSVHPERYALVEKMAKDLGADVPALLADGKLRAKIDLTKYVSDSVGMPTLQDILRELEKPGRDPRQRFEAFSFREGIREIADLREGMRLPGIVTNVTAFGAFVDIGVHQDGLVHISQIADNFVKDPAEVVKVGQKVSVVVVEIDAPRRRIGLSMKANPEKAARVARDNHAGNARDNAKGAGRERGKFARDNRDATNPRRSPAGNSFGSLGDFFK